MSVPRPSGISIALVAALSLTGGFAVTTSNAAPAAHRSVAAASTVTVSEVKNKYQFGPQSLRISRGTVITWTNRTDAEHNVTFDSGNKWNTDFKQNKSIKYTFSKAGTYRYHCEYHPYMKGTIVVR